MEHLHELLLRLGRNVEIDPLLDLVVVLRFPLMEEVPVTEELAILALLANKDKVTTVVAEAAVEILADAVTVDVAARPKRTLSTFGGGSRLLANLALPIKAVPASTRFSLSTSSITTSLPNLTVSRF
jgi:hypothetical protein